MLTEPKIKKLQILDIIKYANVSSVLLLPLFNRLYLNKVSFKYYNNHVYPFSQLCYDNGLVKAYSSIDESLLLKDKTKTISNSTDDSYLSNVGFRLYLLFNKNKINNEFINKNLDKVKIESKYISLADMIISSKYFDELYTLDILPDYVVISLKIPRKYNEDIAFIRNSKYSNVSIQFTDAVNISLLNNNKISDKNVYCFHVNSDIGHYLVAKNLAALITNNSSKLKNKLASELFIEPDKIDECYELFDLKSKEHLDLEKIQTEIDLYNLNNSI
jgi:hypothetical protein